MRRRLTPLPAFTWLILIPIWVGATSVPASATKRYGEVVGPDDEPISGATIWSGVDLFVERTSPVITDSDGRFSLSDIQPNTVLTIIKPGWAPELVSVESGNGDVRIRLTPGERVAFRVVDPDGQPIAYAEVVPHSWRTFTDENGQTVYYRTLAEIHRAHQEPGDMVFPTHTDADGYFRWPWAPWDAVWYGISKEGFVPEYRISRRPGPEETVVTLTPANQVVFDVHGPDGRPLAGAQVLLVPGENPELTLDIHGSLSVATPGSTHQRSDAAGRVHIDHPGGVFVAVASSPYGFGMLNQSDSGEPLRIRPWAAVEIEVTSNGIPESGLAIQLNPAPSGQSHPFQITALVQNTDVNGIARFDRVPAGTVSISSVTETSPETSPEAIRTLTLHPGQREIVRIHRHPEGEANDP
ncbi:MAG TPA: hypothetical protein PKE26_05695 [Kiritimatiellia bacterium]|nr:hypothetical protein [Kiritimatiellia bacterium]HMO98586.1 hypothetical protein [Kiritimatiellia bacterium]HMP95435.1 hypothetical protein [Kiritimatiellia bacterium]